jgi:hypothetical protein
MTRIRQTLGAGKIAHDPTDDTVNKAINKEVGLSGLITFHQLTELIHQHLLKKPLRLRIGQ